MKKLWIGLCFLCLCGCQWLNLDVSMENPIALYYLKDVSNVATQLGSQESLLVSEIRDFPADDLTMVDFLNTYFQGPTSETLLSPFPKGLRVSSAYLDNGVLTINIPLLPSVYSNYDMAVAKGCIVRTVSQFPDVTSVVFPTLGDVTTPLLSSSYLFEDGASSFTDTQLQLYFSDANGRYLLVEDCVVDYLPSEKIPGAIVEALIDGTTQPGRYSAIPEGTTLRSATLDASGLCTIDFSSAFYYNRPTTLLTERVCIYSIVNSLTQRSEIKRVLFLVEGAPLETYYHMDLSMPLERDDTIIYAEGNGEAEDMNLFVKSQTPPYLASLPIMIPSDPQFLHNRLMSALLSYTGINGFSNPLPKGCSLRECEILYGTCHVDFNTAFLDCKGDYDAESMAIGAVVSTLSQIPGVRDVSITINGQSDGLHFFDLHQTFTVDPAWIIP